MKVGTIQFQHRAGQLDYNYQRLVEFVIEGAKESCELIVSPECGLTGYWHLRQLTEMQLFQLATDVVEGGFLERFGELARRHQIVIGVGYVELDKESGRLFNSYQVIGPKGILAIHRKLHCFVNQHLYSGDSYTVFKLPNGKRCGILICYDNNLVENVRVTTLLGAEILLAPHQTGGCDSGSPFAMGKIDPGLWDNRVEAPGLIEAEFAGDKGRGWLMRWLPARAHDNGIFIVFSNGVGTDDDEVRTGNAMILDPYGRVINETGVAADKLVIGVLDFSLREKSTGARWIRARRPELYGELTRQRPDVESTRAIRFEHLD